MTDLYLRMRVRRKRRKNKNWKEEKIMTRPREGDKECRRHGSTIAGSLRSQPTAGRDFHGG